MKTFLLVLFPVFLAVHVKAQLKLPADSIPQYPKSEAYFQQFLEQKKFIFKMPVINPKEFISKTPVLKPDSEIKFKMPNAIIPKEQAMKVYELYKDH